MLSARVALVLSVIALVLALRPMIQHESEVYSPGLGEFMTAIQMRHAKLGIAGAEANWDLAHYELDELREGLDDVVKFHPTHEGVKQPLTELVPNFTGSPVKDLDAAITAKDAGAFGTAFDSLTAGCNGCHEAANFKFNRVIRPTAPPVTNQDFKPLPAGQ